jgi:hypothetical protein
MFPDVEPTGLILDTVEDFTDRTSVVSVHTLSCRRPELLLKAHSYLILIAPKASILRDSNVKCSCNVQPCVCIGSVHGCAKMPLFVDDGSSK